jgi:hypothetical protein
MCGINYYNKDVLQSSTLHRYTTAVNTLFQLRSFKQPTDLSNPSNMAGIITNNLIKAETVASQRSPLDSPIFTELQRAASSSHSCNSDQNLLFNILTLARFIGPCISEYAQTTQNKANYHVYPSGTHITKAFTANDFIFHGKNSHVLMKIDNSSLKFAAFIQITWCIQKNHQNGQKIKLSADTNNPLICPVQGALQMVMRARRLAQPDDMPVACYCYRTKKALLIFITGSKIATLLCKAVKKVQPSTSADDFKKYSSHLLRVWACVLLDEANMSPSFIQKCLRWLGDLFKMYLRDTKAIQDKHLAALQSASANVMALICTPLDNVVHSTATMSYVNIPSNVGKDDQMGSYIDEMD